MCEHRSDSVQLAWKPLLRQLIIVSGVCMIYFMLGLCTGAPTVFIPQIRKEANSTDAVNEDIASWLPSIFIFCGVPWTFILPILATFFGRKIPHAVVCFMVFIGFLIMYCSTNVYHILIGEIFVGPLISAHLTTSVITITEYTSVKYRGVFLTVKAATFFWGVLAANAIGTFYHWKNIILVALFCSCYSMFTLLFWPESPIWLVTQNRFDECADSHRRLKGSDKDSEKELQRLISKYENDSVQSISLKNRATDIIKTLSSKHFYMPIMFGMLLMLLYHFSGKLVCTIYSIDIIRKMTKSDSTAYTGMLILDTVTVFSMNIGCFMSKFLKRRTLLITAATIGVAFLFSMSLYLYLVNLNVIVENKYLSIFLLVGFSVAISCGPMIMAQSIMGELIPLESRCLSVCVIALMNKIVNGTFIKLSPYGFKLLGMHGTFFTFGVLSSICLVLIYLYIPETKDKTSQEIADYLRGGVPHEEVKELIGDKNYIIVPGSKTQIDCQTT